MLIIQNWNGVCISTSLLPPVTVGAFVNPSIHFPLSCIHPPLCSRVLLIDSCQKFNWFQYFDALPFIRVSVASPDLFLDLSAVRKKRRIRLHNVSLWLVTLFIAWRKKVSMSTIFRRYNFKRKIAWRFVVRSETSRCGQPWKIILLLFSPPPSNSYKFISPPTTPRNPGTASANRR